jgi:small subunit ribosomal protein S16
MLTIRMQRGGRKGHPQYRVVVQDSRFSPTSGRVVASIGTYNPHSKEVTIDAVKATSYLANGAQPSPRVALLLKAQGVELPKWVKLRGEKTRTTRHAGKLRRNTPAEEKVAVVAESNEATEVVEATTEETPVEA